MTQASNPWSDWFNYVFTYFPTTNWQHAFSPTFNFGNNVQDAPVEKHVLDTVGSYGSQLNRVLDVLLVLTDHPTLSGLSVEEEQKVKAFRQLAQAADEAAKGFEGQATLTGVEKFITGMRSLKQTDPVRYQELKAQILANI
jgi:hypothetical protein